MEYDGELIDVDHGPEARWPWRIVGADRAVIVDFTGGNDVSEVDAYLMAAAPLLRDALNQASVELSILKSAVLSGESWSPTLDESYRIMRDQISAAITVARGEQGGAL